MNAQKLTQKALEAIQTAQNIAIENQNIQILPEHLFYALLDGEDGLVNNLFRKMGKNPDALLAETDTLIRKLPAVSGSGREPDKVYISPLTDKILTAAEKLAAGMKDDYVSVEHIMLCIFDYAEGALKDIFRAHGITKDGFLKELKKVKTDRITSDNPETTYDALNKYGFDLVERARSNKLDPVIGRDGEIRNGPNNNGRFRVKTGSISGYRFHSSKYIERNTRKRFPSLLCKSNGNSVKRPDRRCGSKL